MASTKEAIRSLDRYPASPELLFKGITEKKNIFSGLFTIVLVIAGLGLLITKSISVFGKQNLRVQSFNSRNQSEVKLKAQYLLFGLYNFDTQSYIYPHQYFSYGLKFCFQNKSQKITNISTKAYQQYFIIPDVPQLSVVGNIGNLDYQDTPVVRTFMIGLQNCTESDGPQCNTQAARPQLLPFALIKDHKYNVQEPDANKILKPGFAFLNSQIMILSQQFRPEFKVQLTKLFVHSDQSVWPSTIDSLARINTTDTYFIPYEMLQVFNSLSPAYFTIVLTRSPFTQQHYRSFGRVDQMLGEVFGLVGLFSLIGAYLFSNYNRWAMKRTVSHALLYSGEHLQPESLSLYLKSVLRENCGQQAKSKELDILQLYRNQKLIMQKLGLEEQPLEEEQPEEGRGENTKEEEQVSAQQGREAEDRLLADQ